MKASENNKFNKQNSIGTLEQHLSSIFGTLSFSIVSDTISTSTAGVLDSSEAAAFSVGVSLVLTVLPVAFTALIFSPIVFSAVVFASVAAVAETVASPT